MCGSLRLLLALAAGLCVYSALHSPDAATVGLAALLGRLAGTLGKIMVGAVMIAVLVAAVYVPRV